MTENDIKWLLENDEFLKSRAEYSMWKSKYEAAFKEKKLQFFDVLVLYGYRHYSYPIEMEELIGVHQRNLYLITKRLQKKGYLREDTTKGRKNNKFIFPAMELTEAGKMMLGEGLEIWKKLAREEI